jgi:hypothetical protein
MTSTHDRYSIRRVNGLASLVNNQLNCDARPLR